MKTKVLLLFIGLYLGLSPGGMMAQTGAALDFDGVNDFVNVPSSASLESYGTTNQITIEYWVKPNGVLNNGFDPLLTKRYTSNTAGILINQATAAGVHTHWLRFTTGWQRIDVPYTVGAWNHVAVTYQSGSGMTVYVNGAQAGTNPINGVLAVNNAPLQIGGETAFNAFKYSGQIDEVRMWNRSLSASEINASYACQLSGNEAGLIAYYQFNEGVAGGGNAGVTSLPDISGNGNTGTLQNFALNGATSNWVAPGGVPNGVACSDPGSALDFDGNDNIVNIPSTATLESYATTNAITVEYWVNPDPTLNYSPTPTQTQVFEPLVSKRFTSNNAGILIDKLTAAGVHTHWLRFTTGWERIDVPYPTNTWSHVALTYESGSGMNVFINGVQVGTNPINGQLVVNSAPLQIGGETAVYGYKYRGQIDEFRMWDRALSATEINDQKDCELPGGQPGLLAYYQFNEGTAAGPNAGVTNLPDISGNGHNGTLHDFILSGPNSNWVAPGGVVNGVACILDPCANDTEAPTIVCNSGNGNITVNNDPGQCGAVVSYNVAPNDNCSIQSVAQTSGFPNGVLHPVGTTTNTFVVTDSAGNTGTCSFDVTVTDNEGPTINCAVSAGAPNLLSNSSFENAVFNQLFNDVDWTTTGAVFGIDAITLPPAQDGNRYLKMFGADSRVSQTVPVNGGDVITASAFVKNASFDPIGQPGGGYIQVTLIGGPAAVITSPFITSNAPIDQWQQIATAPITIPTGAGYTGAQVELITQQPGGGAVMWDEAFIGVNGGGLLAGDISVGNDPGQCGAQVSVATPLSEDNCGIASITNDRNNTSDASGFYPIGTTTVTWTAVDQAGFSTSCSVDVTVNDTEAPTIICNTGVPDPNTNILKNQSFEVNNGHNQQNPADWTQFGPVFNIDQNQLGMAQEGDFYTKMFSGNAGLFQDHPVNPGDVITASIYIMNASFDQMGPVGGGQIKLEWPGTGAPQDVSAVVGASSPLDQWVQVTLTATAPPGATTVRFVAITNLPAGGAAFFDNAFMGNSTTGDGGPIIVNNDEGECGAVISYNNTPTDNCAIQSVAQTSGFANGVLFPVGTTTNTFVVTDTAGNTGTCSFDVTVIDAEAPIIDCSVSSGAANLLSNASFENAVFNQLFNDVDWTRTGAVFGIDAIFLPPSQDGNRYLKMFGADSRVSQTVPVTGGDVLTASAYVLNASFDQIGQPGGGFIQVTLIGGPAAVITSPFITSTAPIDQWQQIATAPITIPSGVGYTGALVELITQQPGGGAVMWDDAFIGVNGGGLLAGNVTVDNDPGQCGAQVSVATPFTSDNCGIASITNDYTNSSDASGFYPVGTTTVNWTAVDQAGFSATCSVEITVNDTEAPTIECSTGFPDPNANILNNQSFEVNNGHNQQNPSDWVQFGPVFTIDQNQLGMAQDGDFYAKMFSGNAGLFQDHPVNPGDVITASIYIMNASFDPMGPVGGGQIKLEWPGTGAPQDVSAVVGASSPLDQWVQVTLTATAPAGATTVRFVAITNLPAGGAAFFDNAFMGNSTSGNGGPIIVDTDPGQCGAVINYNINSTDNCGIQSVAQTSGFANGTLHPVGTTTNTFVATDSAGNSATCSFDVIVTDNEAPNAVCQDITVYLDANGVVFVTAADIDGGSSDPCGIASISTNAFVYGCGNVGPNSATLTVTDIYGNVGSCNAVITVEDTISPTANCQDITVALDANGSASLTPFDLLASVSDNCGSITCLCDSLSQRDFDCDDVGVVSVVVQVTDVNGNTSTCTSNVTVEDNIAPVAVCQDITVQLDANGQATIAPADVDGGSSDNCNVILNATPLNFDCSNVGSNNSVVLTASDSSGNSDNCTANVTVEDNVAPNAICADITIQLDGNGNASITAADVDGGSTDNCAIASVTASPTSFDCSTVGSNTVTLTVTDVNGNVSTCTADVTVEDNIAPNAICQDITVQLDANGNASITGADIDNGSTDNCSIASLSVDPGTLDCSGVGNSNPVTLTVTDVNGNTSTCTANVTVEDNIAPTAVCQDITVQLDPSGSIVVNASDIDGGSSDNCSFSLSTTDNIFDCDDITDGPRAIILTVTDGSGNVSTCSAVVTVVDTTNSICCPLAFDFEADAAGNSLPAGTVVSNQYASDGVVISAENNNGPDVAIIFDSGNPTGGDTDLGTPNQQYGGPGIGNGGASNDVAEDNILIIAENVNDNNNDGLIDNPDDDANGGRLFFDFTDRAVTIETVRLVDLDDGPWNITLELANGFVVTIPVPTSGNNSALTVPVFQSNVRRMIVEMGGSGGVAGFAWCPDGPQITVCSTPLDFDRDDQGGFLPAGSVITNQWAASRNVNISATNNRGNGPDAAILFNSASPTGGDTDLGCPGAPYGGPGVGNGGGSNVIPEGNLLIIAERMNDNNNDGLVDNPDDEAAGGQLRFDFTNYASVDSIIIIDNDENNSFITVELMGGGTQTFPISNPGDNGRQPVAIGLTNVTALVVDFERSGAVADLFFCADGAPITMKSEPASAASGESERMELGNSFDAFPNPFIGQTTLRFELNESGHVELEVYDLRGKLIANVFNGEVEAFQVYETEFKQENVTSGIYQARLVTESGKVYYKKLILGR